MAISLLTSVLKQGTSGGSGTSAAIDTTGATLIVAMVADYEPSSPSTFSDSETNTWTGLTARSVASNMRARFYYVVNPTTSATHTFSASGTDTYATINVASFSGTLTTSPFHVQNGATLPGGGTSLSTGEITAASIDDNELLIYGLATAANTTQTVNIGTLINSAAFVGGQSYGVALGYEVQTTATTRNPSFSWTNSATSAAVIAAFKAAAAGGTSHASSGTPAAQSAAVSGTAIRTAVGGAGKPAHYYAMLRG